MIVRPEKGVLVHAHGPQVDSGILALARTGHVQPFYVVKFDEPLQVQRRLVIACRAEMQRRLAVLLRELDGSQ